MTDSTEIDAEKVRPVIERQDTTMRRSMTDMPESGAVFRVDFRRRFSAPNSVVCHRH